MKESKTVLVVDDEKFVRDFIAYALQATGYNTLTALDGKDALEILSSNADIDLIITDIRMPYSGIKLVEDLRKKLKLAIPFIMISGEYPDSLAEMCMKWGGAGYLVKPFQISELMTTVDKILNQ